MLWGYAMVALILGSDANPRVKPKDMQKWCTSSEAQNCEQSGDAVCYHSILTQPVVMYFPSSGYEEIEECQIGFHAQPMVLMRRHTNEQIECGWVGVMSMAPTSSPRGPEYDLCDIETFEHQDDFVVKIVHKTGKMAAFNMSLTAYTNASTCVHSDELCCEFEGLEGHICDSNRCVSSDAVCDGVVSCVDGSDEGMQCCGVEGYEGEGCVGWGESRDGRVEGMWAVVVVGVAVAKVWE